MKTPLFAPDAATSNNSAAPVTDKKGFAARWLFSPRHVDNLIAQGLPYLAVGKRRVRIVVSEGDAWMRQRFSRQRRGPAQAAATVKE
jgi:hypothetical protein